MELSNFDIDIIIKALKLYDHHVVILNSEIFEISEDDLSTMNNDCEYIKGIISHLEQSKSSSV